MILIRVRLPLRELTPPVGLRLDQRAPRLRQRPLVSDARAPAPAGRDACRISEIGARAAVEVLDQTQGDGRVVELAEQILQNCGLARVALGRRRRVKEMAEKLGRVAQVLQRDAQRVPLLRSERPEMPPALANLSVQPVEALCGEADGWLLEPAKTVLRRPAPPAALRHDMFEDKREARRPLVCGEPENRRAACLGLRLRRAQKAVEPRLVGKT